MPATGLSVVVAMDKFRSTATAAELAQSIVDHGGAGVTFDVVELSDGGEGFRATFDGEVVTLRVRGPWGDYHDAPMTLVRRGPDVLGVIEVAEIIGRSHQSAPTSTQALAASSAGVGDAILASARWGVTRVVVGCGGSATSDGGAGCYDVLREHAAAPVALTAATDVDADYLGALRYAPQKGVDDEDLAVVARRLDDLATRFERDGGPDVRRVARAGAAGGLGGALFARGADLVSGFDETAALTALRARLATAAAVITGEGRLDAGSLEGKVVAGVCALTAASQRVLVVCGSLEGEAARALRRRYPWVRVVDLVSRVGERRAFEDTARAVGELTAQFLAGAD